MFPRSMNNKEKAILAIIKEYGFAYELKFNHSPYSGGYVANIPILKETWCLNSPLTEKHRKNIQDYLSENNLKANQKAFYNENIK